MTTNRVSVPVESWTDEALADAESYLRDRSPDDFASVEPPQTAGDMRVIVLGLQPQAQYILFNLSGETRPTQQEVAEGIGLTSGLSEQLRRIAKHVRRGLDNLARSYGMEGFGFTDKRSIMTLDLDAGTSSPLFRHAIVAVGQLAQKTDTELCAVTGLGEGRIAEIRAALKVRGLLAPS